MVSGLYCQKTMKIIGNFIYILRSWPGYSMLSTVTSTTMDYRIPQTSTDQSFGLCCPVLPLQIQPSLASR